MESMASTSNLLSGFPLLPVRSVSDNSSRSWAFNCASSAANKKMTTLWGRPQHKSFGKHYYNNCSRKSMVMTCGAVSEINETQFPDVVLKSDRPVLVEFVATWCGPCRLIAPVIEWAAQEYQEQVTVVKIDHDANPRLIEEYKVYGLPALILFKNGKEVAESRREGAITKAKIKAYLDALLDSVSVS